MRKCAVTLESELAPDELHFLLNTIHHSQFMGKHLEIGTAAGGTLWQMATQVRQDNPHPFVVIDPMSYFADQFSIVQNNMRRNGIHADKVDFRVQTSLEAFEKANRHQEFFDFIFIDANHKLRYVAQDLRWTRLLNVKGKLALHDYSDQFPGVRIAVNRFLNKYPSYQKIGHVRDLVIIEKTAKSTSPEVSDIDLLFAELLTPILQWKCSFSKA